MAKKLKDIIGSWAFLIGVILAVLSGILAAIPSLNISLLDNMNLLIAMVVIGIVIGLFNISNKEVTPFLLSGTCLVLVSSFGVSVLGIIPIVRDIIITLLAIFVPATIIVAIKNVFSLAKN
jgi:hypothetical protein